MKKVLTVEELRERPDALIEAIDSGESVTITRDGKEIATTNPVGRGDRVYRHIRTAADRSRPCRAGDALRGDWRVSSALTAEADRGKLAT